MKLKNFKEMTKEQKVKIAIGAAASIGLVVAGAVVCGVIKDKNVEKYVKNMSKGCHLIDVKDEKTGECVAQIVDFMEGDHYVATIEVLKDHVAEALKAVTESAPKVIDGTALIDENVTVINF